MNKQNDPLNVVASLLGTQHPLLVDAGANKGRVLGRLLELFPGARVLAFEPINALARKLAKKFPQENVTVCEMALGETPGLAKLNVLASRTLSSLLAPQDLERKYPQRDLATREVVEVKVVRLDSQLERAPDFIKLDLQGFELSALKGLGKLLCGVKFILSEVSFVQLYQNQPLYNDILEYLEERGFRLIGLFDEKTGADGQKLSADALFASPKTD